jgi:hypothetical protein
MREMNNLEGKTIYHENDTHLVKSFKKVGIVYVLITNKRVFNFYEKEFKEFMDNQKTKEMEVATIENESDIIQTALLDALKKVQVDKGYINQANAICNIVSQMINVKKTQILIAKDKKLLGINK